MRYWIAPHLAFLVQWLRILGIDIRIWRKGITLGSPEERLIQWNRYPLLLRTVNPPLTLTASSRETLLREFFLLSGIRPELADMFKRCLRCNSRLSPLEPEEAQRKWPDLPPYVRQTQERFNWCDQCRKLFWAGTHVQNMIQTLEDWEVLSKAGE